MNNAQKIKYLSVFIFVLLFSTFYFLDSKVAFAGECKSSTTGTTTCTIPPGVTKLFIKAWGSGGGGGGGGSGAGADGDGGGGGGGGFASGDYATTTTNSQTILIYVGDGGALGAVGSNGTGAGGGGASRIWDSNQYVLIAGGGGGGGGGADAGGEDGGGGGGGGGDAGGNGADGTNATCGSGIGEKGFGATTANGGVGGSACSTGTNGTGGARNKGGIGGSGAGGAGGAQDGAAGGAGPGGGGGGGGAFGGGGGETGVAEGGGGGGGGSGTTTPLTNVTTGVGTIGTTGGGGAGTGGAAANNTDTDYTGSVGVGGNGGAEENSGTAGNDGKVVITWATTTSITQVAYRFFANDNTADVGRSYAINSTSTVPTTNTPLRLRILLSLQNENLSINGTTSKLQFAENSLGAACSSLSGWADVSSSTAARVSFFNNPGVSDGAALTQNKQDPRFGTTTSHTVRNQIYSEGEFNLLTNSQVAVAGGEDMLYDFSVTASTSPRNSKYCFRMIQHAPGTDAVGGTYTYNVYPELKTPNVANVKLRDVRLRDVRLR